MNTTCEGSKYLTPKAVPSVTAQWFCCYWRQKGQKQKDNAEKLHPHHTSLKDRDPEIACVTESQLTWERMMVQAQKYSEQKCFWLIESSYSRDQEQKTYKNLYKDLFSEQNIQQNGQRMHLSNVW